ncbi:MAG TPA: hypothetical protein VGX24_17695 [Pyrinomonadaceae bacterium]|nr:hypothetical protein [Pyrinomonadaceae bacterium]
MLDRIRQEFENVFGFKCKRRVRYSIVVLLLIIMLGAAYLAFLAYLMPYSAILAMIIGFGLILFLCMDTFFYYLDLFHSSPTEVLPLAKSIDPLISKTIGDAEEHLNGSLLLNVGDLLDPSVFIRNLREGQDSFTSYLRDKFSPDVHQLLDQYAVPNEPEQKLLDALVQELNQLLKEALLYKPTDFPQVQVSEETMTLLEQNPQGKNLVRLNRRLFEDAYPREIAKGLEGEKLKAEIESQAREICADFETRPSYPRITAVLFKRAVFNFILTVFCFAIATWALTCKDKYSGATTPTYGHDCSVIGNPVYAALHAFYYHSVIFQSLGDGEHGPKTNLAQAIASGETYFALFYLTLILGGIYNTASVVRDNLTPIIFRESLVKYFTTICASKMDIGREDFGELDSKR